MRKQQVDKAAGCVKSIAHPIRLSILAILVNGERNVQDLGSVLVVDLDHDHELIVPSGSRRVQLDGLGGRVVVGVVVGLVVGLAGADVPLLILYSFNNWE